jgi:hypothetical protein
MQNLNALQIGEILAFATLILTIIGVAYKFYKPISQSIIKFNKVENIAKNHQSIKENSSQIRELQAFKSESENEIKEIKSNILEISKTLNLVADGVNCLLGDKLGFLKDVEQDTKVYRALKQLERRF